MYWFVTSLYVILIALATVFTVTYTEAEKVVDFLGDSQEALLADDARLLAATAIANRHDGSDAFVKKEPLLTVEYTSAGISFRLEGYALSIFKNDAFSDTLAILIENLTIDDELAALDADGRHTLGAEVTFNRAITVGTETATRFSAAFATLFDDSAKLFLIEFTPFWDDGPLSITAMTLFYQLQDGSHLSFYALTEAEIGAMSEEAIAVSAVYGADYAVNDAVFYDPELLPALNSYNVYYLKNIGIELAIVAGATYFFFFHRRVRASIRKKKATKAAAAQNENNQTGTPSVR